MNWFKRTRAAFSRKSIRQKTLFSFTFMAVGLIVVTSVALIVVNMTMNSYRRLSGQMEEAGRVYSAAGEQVGLSAYYLVSGRTTVATSTLQDELQEISSVIMRLSQEAEGEESRKQLLIIQRTLGNLKRYANQLVEQIENREPIDTQNNTLEQIRDLSALIEEQISQYIYIELDEMAQREESIRSWANTLVWISILIVLGVTAVMAIMQYAIDRSISVPIDALVKNLRLLSEGDFSARTKNQGANEIDVLNDSFNRMVKKLQLLMEELEKNTRMREQLELRLLQEQINPHFLYNTLELIVWLAESGEKETIVNVVQSLSHFFRVVLSQGRAVISVEEELSGIKSYLYIQQIRYSDILRYQVEAEPDALGLSILKLTLQPLVENALYHGIKTRRGGGTILVQVKREKDELRLTVSDTGSGMSAEQLQSLREAVAGGQTNRTGFGLLNVQKRVQLEYGQQYGMELDAEENGGTTVTLHLPALPYTAV